jgi:hypothetical protein
MSGEKIKQYSIEIFHDSVHRGISAVNIREALRYLMVIIAMHD